MSKQLEGADLTDMFRVSASLDEFVEKAEEHGISEKEAISTWYELINKYSE